MKKTITLMLCIILCFSILSGCAQTSDNIEDITKEYIVKISENDYNSASKYFSDEYREKTSEEKEILSLKRELYDLKNESKKYEPIRKFYKNKLVEFGVMKSLKNVARTGNKTRYIKVK